MSVRVVTLRKWKDDWHSEGQLRTSWRAHLRHNPFHNDLLCSHHSSIQSGRRVRIGSLVPLIHEFSDASITLAFHLNLSSGVKGRASAKYQPLLIIWENRFPATKIPSTFTWTTFVSDGKSWKGVCRALICKQLKHSTCHVMPDDFFLAALRRPSSASASHSGAAALVSVTSTRK